MIVHGQRREEENEVCKFDVIYSWRGNLPVIWPNSTFARNQRKHKRVAIGIKIFQNRIFLNIPRWRNNHPINVATVEKPQNNKCIQNPTGSPVKYKTRKTARQKTNTNYENLVSDTVEKRVTKNLLCDSCWSSSWVKKVF